LLALAIPAAAEPPGAERAGPRFALLVGVQEYPKLGAAAQLRGCRNDVAIMRQLLIDRFHFADRDIVILQDREATAAGIRREVAALVKKVRALPPGGPPAQVVFHFSGHGSQVPDQPAGHPDHDEEDGLDETLVPYDADRAGGEKDVRDDEVFHLVEDV